MAPTSIKAIAVLDMENYVWWNRHLEAACVQLFADPNVQQILQQREEGLFPDASAFADALFGYVLGSAVVREFTDAIHADLRRPADLVRPAFPDLCPEDDVRLVVVTDHNHKSDQVLANRAANIKARLQAAVEQGWITQHKLSAWAAKVHPETLADVVNIAPISEATVGSDSDSDSGSASEPGNDISARVRTEATQVLHRRLGRLCRRVFYDSKYVTRVDGASADEVIAVLARKLRPGLLCVLSADMDFCQLERYEIAHVRPDKREAYPKYDNMRGDVFLLKCALRGKGTKEILEYGPAFGPIPQGFRYLDAIGVAMTGTFNCTPEYRDRFESFNRLTGEETVGQPWNGGSLVGVLEWLAANEDHAPEDVRVRFLRNVFRQNIDPEHDVFSITPHHVRTEIDRAVESMIRKRGWAELVR